MRRFVLCILLCISTIGFSQIKTYEKAKIAFSAGKLKAAVKLIDKCLMGSETKNNPNVLLLKSKIMFGIYMDKSLLEDFPNALKDALKYAEKSIELNKVENIKTTFRADHIEYFTILIKQNNKEALEAYHSKKYSKALPLFKKSIAFGLDTQALVFAGDCYWQMGLESESIPYFKKSADIIYAAVLDSHTRVFGYFKEPFRKLGKYYIDRNQPDSAYIIVKNGREILPNDPILTEYTYKLMFYALDKIPPSVDYLQMVRQGLRDFPTDSFLNHRENSIYIFLLNGMAIANEQVQFDSLLNSYAASKAAKGKLKTLHIIKKYDIFAGETPDSFINHLKYYFAALDLNDACYANFKSQVNRTWKTLPDNQLEKEKSGVKPPASPFEQIVLKMAMEENNTKVVEIIFRRHLQLYPQSNFFVKGRTEYTNLKNKTTLAYYDLFPMILLNDESAKAVPKDLTYKTKAKEYRLRLINATTDSGDFRLSRRIWFESAKLYPEQNKILDIQWRRIVENDFRINYFGSRVNAKGKNEINVPEYNWNGNVDSCLAGNMSLSIMTRVEKRINYFRRMSGVSEEIILTTLDNEYCQYAAMMCEANKTMSHEPFDGWRCYIPAGADALKNSILSKDGNPCIAITAAMGQNHATVGNRRWLLYPKALYMGIGTSTSFSVIKAIDNSNVIDSNKYKKTYISWPPANYCPKMLVFKKWSFSIDDNLAGATVTIKDAGNQPVSLKLETYTPGYGMNTLVFEPDINLQILNSDAVYHVFIKLASGKLYSYDVKIIDVKI